MNQLGKILLLLFFFFFFHSEAQSPLNTNDNLPPDVVNVFHPTIAVIIAILSVMITLTFFLLLCAKFCHRQDTDVVTGAGQHPLPGLPVTRSRRFSGIDKTVIESLPFFRFSTLKGSREGLECVVCLSKFEDIELLRLLPKCKHAFHIGCVDKWLESHSSCPLCRLEVTADDLTLFTHSNSLRFPPELTEDPNLELFVRRQPDINKGSSRFSVGSSFRKMEKGKEELVVQEEGGGDKEEDGRKLLLDFKNRWSDVNSSDFLLLNSEMVGVLSSRRFEHGSSSNGRMMKIKEEMERKRVFESKVSKINGNSLGSGLNLPSSSDSRLLSPSGKRSMSEIVKHSRFEDLSLRNVIRDNGREERMRKMWIPIARRTVQWFVGRERRSQQESLYTRKGFDV